MLLFRLAGKAVVCVNQGNYQKFVMAGPAAARRKMLKKILAGNLLSLSKGLGLTVTGHIEVSSFSLEQISVELKSTPMIAFSGGFCKSFQGDWPGAPCWGAHLWHGVEICHEAEGPAPTPGCCCP
jgi:hypothetical protein